MVEQLIGRVADLEARLGLAGTARKRCVDLLEWLTQAMKASLTEAPIPAFQS